MITLSIDTSAAASVALVDADGTAIAARTTACARKHTEVVGEYIREVTSVGPRPQRVVVGVGPGPFTGLRAGIAAGIGYSVGAGIAIHGVRSHDAIAMRMAAAGDLRSVLIATDARRKEVYWSLYDLSGTVPRLVQGPAVDTPAQLRAAIDAGLGCMAEAERPALVGRGFELYADILGAPAKTAERDSEPQATDLARAALSMGESALLDVSPLYLRDPDAKPLPGREQTR